MSGDPRLTRRALLLAGLAALAAACRPKHSARAARPTPAGSAARASAYQIELEVAATYEAAMRSAGPTVQALIAPLRDDHRRHLSALGHGSARAAVFAPESSRDLAATERSSAAELTRAAASAPDGRTAALLASIAASHQAHRAHLRSKPFRW
jgi:hypothetical protein